MSDSSPAAVASAAEEWSDADFDLPDGSSLIRHFEETSYTRRGTSGQFLSHQSQLPQLTTKPSRPTYMRMSTGPEDIEEEDDMAAFLAEDDSVNADTIKPSRGIIAAASQSGGTAPMTGLITRYTGSLVTKLRGASAIPRVNTNDDDWETDLDFPATSRAGGFKQPPVLFAPPIHEDSTWNEQEDDEDVSTIKASRLPPVPASSESTDAKLAAPANTPLPPSPLQSPSHSTTFATMGEDDYNDDSMESAFELPPSLSKLSLRPLSHHSSKATLSTLSEWASDATTTTATSATSEFFESDGHPGKATLSASPSTDFTTDEEDGLDEDEREAKEVEGLVLPETFLPKDLVRILDSKKKGLADATRLATSGSNPPVPRSKHADDEDDFEKGLLIDNDSELSPSRLLRKGEQAGGLNAVGSGVKSRLRPKMLTVPLSRVPQPSVRASPSQVTLKRAKTTLAPPSAASSSIVRDALRNARSPSPQPRRSEESTTSSSALSSKASVVTLRRTKVASRATPPPSSFPRPFPSSQQQPTKQKEPSPPPLSHSYSMLTLPRIPGSNGVPGSPSKAMKHQKSTSRLLVSPKSLTPSQGGSGKEVPSPMRLGRKASLSSLVDAEKARERISRERASKTSTMSSGSGSGSGTTSASTSQAGSTGKTSSLQRPSTSGGGNTSAVPRYNAPTASSLAKMATPTERPSLTSLFVPVPRPTTPIHSPGTSRLTMPTASSRAKARVPVTAVFPGQTQSTSPPSRQSSTSPVPMARVVSPSRLRPIFPVVKVGPKLMKKPKSARTYGDGTELDALDDLAVEKDKEQKFRVNPKATSNGSRIATTSNTRERRPTISTSVSAPSTATIGRKTPVGVPTSTSTGTSTSTVSVKRPPSRASELPRPTSAASTSTTGTLLRRRSRMDFTSTTTITPLPSTSTSASTTTASAANSTRLSVPLLSPPPAPAAYATLRRKRGSPKTQTITQRKPTLIRNLSGVGSPKVIGDMRWNPATMRWEGNDSALRSFESPLHSARPALITQLTGSSLGGVGSPTSSLLSGARIVGNMIFDPTKMCWINRFADDEPDPFAGMDDEDEDKDATLGKRRGTTFRVRSNTGNLGAPSLGTPLETVTGSPARSAASRSSNRTRHSTTSESEAESVLQPLSSTQSSVSHEDDWDDNYDAASGSGGVGSPERTRRAAMTRGASMSPVPGVDAAMVETCRAAEARHRTEMKGWFPRRRAVSIASRGTLRRRLGDMFGDDVENADALDRSYLYEIRALATRQY